MTVMNPFDYLEFDKDDIMASLSAPGMYSKSEAIEIYELLIQFVGKFNEVRQSESKTKEILNEIGHYDADKAGTLRHWLIKSIQDDDTFSYAYTKLVQNSNRFEGTNYEIKTPTKPEMALMLAKERTHETKEVFIDYSDNSIVDKIAFLHELGVLDFLQDKMKKNGILGTNKLAEVVSTFTSEKQSTLASYLNTIYSKHVDQKNNPLKNIDKIKNKLINIGIKA